MKKKILLGGAALLGILLLAGKGDTPGGTITKYLPFAVPGETVFGDTPASSIYHIAAPTFPTAPPDLLGGRGYARDYTVSYPSPGVTKYMVPGGYTPVSPAASYGPIAATPPPTASEFTGFLRTGQVSVVSPSKKEISMNEAQNV